MGIRIHKAIGWGLTGEQFRENIGFEIVDDDLEETLSDKLHSIKTLTVPERSVAKIFDEWRGFITEPNLLATEFSLDNPKRKPKTISDASSLHHAVSDYDQPTDVHLFLPSALYLNMHRSDNTLDYVEGTHDLKTGEFANDPTPYRFVELKQNPYPWGQQFMDPETGEQVREASRYDEKNSLAPQPPPEVRWWLTETGILKPGAWKLLRPYYALWWG